MEEKEEILTAIQQLDQKFDQRFNAVDQRFADLEQQFDTLHQSQIKLEGMQSDIKLIAEDVTDLKRRFAAWESEDPEESIPARVSRLEMRVTRLEKKKRT